MPTNPFAPFDAEWYTRYDGRIALGYVSKYLST